MKNSREIGKKLEKIIAERLREVGDKYARPTKNSGASTEIGDVLSKLFFVQAKKRNTKSFSISMKEWDKLESQIPINSLKPIIYVNENKDERKFITIEFEDFFRLLKEIQ